MKPPIPSRRGVSHRPWAALPALSICVLLAAPAALGEVRELTLREAIAGALEKNEGILVERVALDSAEAAVSGARGAYDPLLQLDSGWHRSSTPVNSAFSGAPEGDLAPTTEDAETSASLQRLLPGGAQVLLRTSTSRSESDASFDLLSPAWTSTLGFEVRQPLLRYRATDAARLGLRVAAADRHRAAASLRREVLETAAAVEGAYWTLLAARREIEVRQEAVELADEQLSQTRIRIESGVLPETEIAQPRAELERRRGEQLVAREGATRAETRLKLLILGDGDGDLWLDRLEPVEEAAVEVETVDAAELMEKALALRAEIGAAEAERDRRRAQRAFATEGVRPSLDLVVSYDRFGLAGDRNPAAEGVLGLPTDVPSSLEGGWGDSLEQLVDGDFDDVRIALVFALTLGNRRAKADARIAENAERQADADLAATRKRVRAEVLDATAAIETADGRIDAARAAREAAEVQLDAENERFGVGLSTSFLVLTRQNDLARARLDEIEALTDYRIARAELGRATGALLEERGIEFQAR